MNRILIDRMREMHPGLTTAEATRAVEQVFGALRGALESGNDVMRIPKFGTFRRKFRDTRQVRNPRTGDWSTKLAHHVITFKEVKSK